MFFYAGPIQPAKQQRRPGAKREREPSKLPELNQAFWHCFKRFGTKRYQKTVAFRHFFHIPSPFFRISQNIEHKL